MGRNLRDDLEKVLAAMAQLYADEGQAREVAVLALSKATIEQTDYSDENGGLYTHTIYLEIPDTLYHQLGREVAKIEDAFKVKANQVTRMYSDELIEAFAITAELTDDEGWRDKAKAFLTGQGISNQGRAVG